MYVAVADKALAVEMNALSVLERINYRDWVNFYP
jgi:hypothetical protein